MAPSVKTRPQPTPFDQARLQTLTEPLTMRIERVKGNAYQVMPLPVRDGYAAPGQGFSQEEVMGIEQWTVGTFGGGTYKFTATDSAGEQMTWTQIFPLAQYPEKYPVIQPDGSVVVAPASGSSAGQAPVPVPPPYQQPAPPAGPWPPPAYAQGPQMPMQQPMANPFGLPFYPSAAALSPFATPFRYPGAPMNDDSSALKIQLVEQRYQAQLDRLAEENRRMAEENRRVLEEVRRSAEKRPAVDDATQMKLEREREQRYNAEKEAEKARFEATLKSIEDRMSNRGSSSEEERRRYDEERQRREDERRREEARLEREREERRLEREEAREERRRQEAQRQQEREDQRRRDEVMLEAMKNKGPDPTVQLLMEQQRQQAELAREQARLQAEAAKEQARLAAEAARERVREQEVLMSNLRTHMMSPTEVARMVKEASSGQDQFVKTMAGTFNDVFGTVRDWFANMSQMMNGGGESPVVRVIEGGISQAKDMFQTWQRSKAQAAVAQANAAAAAHQPPMPPPAYWETPPPVVQQQQAAAPQAVAQPTNGNGAAKPNGNGAAVAPTNGSSAGLGNADAPPAPKEPVRLGGKTDAEWFGPALPDVLELRNGAYYFYESARLGRMTADGKRPEGIGPDQIAQLIVQAAHIVESQKIQGVPAFDYLFKNQMYPQLIEILLPDLPADGAQGFRDHVAQYLYDLLKPGAVAQAKPVEEVYGGAEFEDDDEGDGDEAR